MHGYKWPINSPRTRTGLMALLLEAGGDEWIVMNSSFRSRIRCQMVDGHLTLPPSCEFGAQMVERASAGHAGYPSLRRSDYLE